MGRYVGSVVVDMVCLCTTACRYGAWCPAADRDDNIRFVTVRIEETLNSIFAEGASAGRDEPEAIQEDLLAVLKVCARVSFVAAYISY